MNSENGKTIIGRSVTGRIDDIKQPRGGYINPRSFETIQLDDGMELGPENISPITMGLAVDYMSRLSLGCPKEDAFKISIMGGLRGGRLEETSIMLNAIGGLDDDSIINACRLTLFDSYYRAGVAPSIEPLKLVSDHQTRENIRIMVNRVKSIIDKYGPVIEFGPTFHGGYSRLVQAGDADFVTRDVIWDLKVSKNAPNSRQTLQLAMYYLMGRRSSNRCFEEVSKVGIINPRLNKIYLLDMNTVPDETLATIERDVIGYDQE